MSVLLLLDLDGLLVLRQNGKIIIRQGAWEFLEFCLDNYHVGIYTSMYRKNMGLTLKKIMPHSWRKKLLFELPSEYTFPDPQPINEWDTIKRLDKLRDILIMPDGTKFEKIILIDDSERKTRFINKDQVLIAPEFKIDEQPGVLKNLIEVIKKRTS